MPIRASTVDRARTFREDLEGLRPSYPDIDSAVDALARILKLGYDFPEIPIDDVPRTYVRLLDYPPLKADGIQKFRVVYHATDPDPSPTTSYRTYTLLTISVR